MSIIWKAWENTNDANAQWCHLRAIEWKAWPAFVSQPIIPILFIFCPVHKVIIGLFIINCLWILIRDSLLSIELASLGSVFVVFTKWPASIAACGYLVYLGRKPAGSGFGYLDSGRSSI